MYVSSLNDSSSNTKLYEKLRSELDIWNFEITYESNSERHGIILKNSAVLR